MDGRRTDDGPLLYYELAFGSGELKSASQRHIFINYLHFFFIAQPTGVHYNRDVSSLKAVSEQLAKTLITLEPHGIFLLNFVNTYISTLSND